MADKDTKRGAEPQPHADKKENAEKAAEKGGGTNASQEKQEKKEQTSGSSNVILMNAASSPKELKSGKEESATSQLELPTKAKEKEDQKTPKTEKADADKKEKRAPERSKEEKRPAAKDEEEASSEKHLNLGKYYLGFLVLFVALLLVAQGTGWLGPVSVHYFGFWPLLLILIGLSLFSLKRRTGWFRAGVSVLVLLVFIVSAGLLFRSGSVFTVNASGTDSHITGSVEPFDRIVFKGVGSVTLVQAATSTVDVSADKNVMGEIVTESKGGTLTIAYKHPVWNLFLFDAAHMNVVVRSPSINDIELAGSGAVESSGIKTSALTVSLPGSGTITLDGVTSDTLTARLSGNGNMTISGKTGRELMYLSGTGTYHGGSLDSDETGVRISGVGDAYVHANKELNAAVSGKGNVYFTGTPVITDDSVTGSGSVKPAPADDPKTTN